MDLMLSVAILKVIKYSLLFIGLLLLLRKLRNMVGYIFVYAGLIADSLGTFYCLEGVR
jgi:hypothetical protein